MTHIDDKKVCDASNASRTCSTKQTEETDSTDEETSNESAPQSSSTNAPSPEKSDRVRQYQSTVSGSSNSGGASWSASSAGESQSAPADPNSVSGGANADGASRAASDAGEAESVPADQNPVSDGSGSGGTSWATSGAGKAETVPAHELQAGSDGSNDRVGDLTDALAGRTEDIRSNEIRDQWYDDYGSDALGELTDREPSQWREEYNSVINISDDELRKDVQLAVDSDGNPLSDAEIREAVDAHKEELEAAGAFEGWGERDIRNWKNGVVDFVKSQRARTQLNDIDPGRAENLPELAVEGDEIVARGSDEEIVDALDDWESEQLRKVDDTVANIDGELETDEKRKVEQMKEEIRLARDMYEQVTVGDKYLPEVVPANLDGVGKLDDLKTEELRENPGLDEDLVSVREPYVEHLRNNPGDLLGAYQTVDDRTENARYIRSGMEGAPR